MKPEEREFIDRLKQDFPKEQEKIETLLGFIASLENPNIWKEYSGELKYALETNDPQKLYLLEGLARRMHGMIQQETLKAKTSPPWQKWLLWSIAVVIVVCLLFMKNRA